MIIQSKYENVLVTIMLLYVSANFIFNCITFNFFLMDQKIQNILFQLTSISSVVKGPILFSA